MQAGISNRNMSHELRYRCVLLPRELMQLPQVDRYVVLHPEYKTRMVYHEVSTAFPDHYTSLVVLSTLYAYRLPAHWQNGKYL